MGANLSYTVEYSKIGPIFDQVEILNDTKIKLTKDTQESRYTMEFDISDVLDIFDGGAWEDIGEYIEKINSSNGSERKQLIAEMMNDYGTKFEEPEDLIELYKSYKGNYDDYVSDLANKALNNLEKYRLWLEDNLVLVESWV
jgi:hypothetical protein